MQQEKARQPSMLEAVLGPAEYAARTRAAAQQQQECMGDYTVSPSRLAGPGLGAAEPPNPLQALLDAGSRAGPEPEGAHSRATTCAPWLP